MDNTANAIGDETTKIAELKHSMSALFDHMAHALARSYIALYYVNTDTEEFLEFRTENGGKLSEVRHEWNFFDVCRREAAEFVHPEDLQLFRKVIDREFLRNQLDHDGTFMMTYRRMPGTEGPGNVNMKISRMEDDEHFIIIGMTDVDDQMRRRREAERIREEHNAYARISALTGAFLSIYIVVPETGRYREYSASESYRTFDLPKEGPDFFSASRKNGRRAIHPDDLERFLSLFTRDNVFSEIEKSGLFVLSYRLIVDGKPRYVQLKAAMVDESDGRRLVVGLNDIDSQVRQEEAQERLLAQAQKEAHTDALTGVRNRLAYFEMEKRLNSQIHEYPEMEFAVLIFDVNNLKKTNDSLGHQAGDQLLREAAEVIGSTFRGGPVFRVGGDEFVVIARGVDYTRLDELVEEIRIHNLSTARYGGVVIACGVAKYKNEPNVAQVFRRADRNMYEDKISLKAYLSNRSSSSGSDIS